MGARRRAAPFALSPGLWAAPFARPKVISCCPVYSWLIGTTTVKNFNYKFGTVEDMELWTCPKCEVTNIQTQYVHAHDVVHCVCNACGMEWIE